MNSTATPRFWQRLHELPEEVQVLASKNYQLWLANPQHPSLNYKRLAAKLFLAVIPITCYAPQAWTSLKKQVECTRSWAGMDLC